MQKKLIPEIGLIFGKFYPLHCGHIYMIEKASSEVDELHVMLGHESQRDNILFTESKLPRKPDVSDRVGWLRQTFQTKKNIFIHTIDEEGVAAYPNGWKDWSCRVNAVLEKQQIKPTVIFTSEKQDCKWHHHYFGCHVRLIDEKRYFINISAAKIRQNPYQYWNYIAKVARPFFVKRICITENDLLPNLAERFANIYNAHFVTDPQLASVVFGHQQLMSQQNFIDNIHHYLRQLTEAKYYANRYVFTNLSVTLLHSFFKKHFDDNVALIKALEPHCAFDLIIDSTKLSHTNTPAEVFSAIANQLYSHLVL